MFKLYTFVDINNAWQDGVIRLEDSALIPPHEENTDYQQYLEWLAAGNTPEPWEASDAN